MLQIFKNKVEEDEKLTRDWLEHANKVLGIIKKVKSLVEEYKHYKKVNARLLKNYPYDDVNPRIEDVHGSTVLKIGFWGQNDYNKGYCDEKVYLYNHSNKYPTLSPEHVIEVLENNIEHWKHSINMNRSNDEAYKMFEEISPILEKYSKDTVQKLLNTDWRYY